MLTAETVTAENEESVEDRFRQYLPRNLSYCCLYADVITKHVQNKFRLLNETIEELDELFPLASMSPNTGEQKNSTKSSSCQTLTVSTNTSTKHRKYSVTEYSDSGGNRNKVSSCTTSILRRRCSLSDMHPHRFQQQSEVKKAVRFADTLGLKLERVHYVLSSSAGEQASAPSSNPSANTWHLQHSAYSIESSPSGVTVILVPAFTMPSFSPDFQNHLESQQVCLHSVTAADSTVYGIISVINLTFEKTVFVRYTVNDWKSHCDCYATYINGSSVGNTDKFSFSLCVDNLLRGEFPRVFFCICYRTQDGREFWDNNNGQNYCMGCEYKPKPWSVQDQHWVHFL